MLEKETLNAFMPVFKLFGAMVGFGYGLANPLDGKKCNKFTTSIIAAGICTRYPILSIFPIMLDKNFK